MSQSVYGQVERALQKKYPDLHVVIEPRDYNNRLFCSIQLGEKRYLFKSPERLDYKALPAQDWIHRFSQVIDLQVSKS